MSQPYLSLEAQLHDAFWAAEDDSSEVPLMAAHLEKHPGVALEMGCGSGRLLLPLLSRGHRIEGLDLSPDMLEIGKERASVLGLPAVFHQGDMAAWQDGRVFAALLAPAFTLQLADDPEAVLRHWHHLLEPGGGLYLTVFQPYAELDGDLPENIWYDDHQASLADGRKARLRTRHRLDREKRLLHREHHYQVGAASHLSTQRIRWFEHAELVGCLKACGFQRIECFADFDPHLPVVGAEMPDSDGIFTYLAGRKR